MGCNKVVVELDSKVMVDLLVDSTRDNEEEDTFISDCRYLSSAFSHIKYVHVLREGNTCADFLANLGQSSCWVPRFLKSFRREFSCSWKWILEALVLAESVSWGCNISVSHKKIIKDSWWGKLIGVARIN